MRKIRKIRSIVLTVLIAVTNYLCGCSLVGLGAGMAIDDSLSDKKGVTKWECAKIKEGAETTVHLSDGSAISGEFGGLENKSPEKYNREFAEFREANAGSIYLPEIGDTMRIIDWDGDQGMHEFLGFDYVHRRSGRMLKKDTHILYTSVLTKNIAEDKEKYYSLKYLDELKANGEYSVTGEQIKLLSAHSDIPLRTRIALRTAEGDKGVNLENIQSLEVPRGKNWKWVGLGLGLAVDAAIIAVAIAINSMSSGGSFQGSFI